MDATKKQLITDMSKKLQQLDTKSLSLVASNANILLARQELEKKEGKEVKKVEG